MKKYSLFLASIFALFFATTGHVMVQWEVFGPTTCIRAKGKPSTETFIFSALGGQATLKLTNRKVSSATVTFNGQVVFGPSDFNQNVDYLESEIPLLEGQNTLEVLLKGKPGGEVTIQMIQEVAEITPEIVRVRTANCLRAGDIEGALQGFEPDMRSEIIPTLDADQRNVLANDLEKAELIRETANVRWYRYTWTDESGENFVDFRMARDDQGRCIITSW